VSIFILFYELMYLSSNAYVVCRHSAREIDTVPVATSSTSDEGW
jgi:hypothetical protein